MLATNLEEPKPISILIVDDDLDDVYLMRSAIRSAEDSLPSGIEVSGARNGREALEVLDIAKTLGRIPDLMLLDLNMPILNGFEVLEHCRRDPKLKSMPVVIITTAEDMEVKRKATALGADGVHTKPRSKDAMVFLISEVLDAWFV